MYEEKEDRFYYIMMYNENYAQPAMPEGAQEGILRGIYRYKRPRAATRKSTFSAVGRY